MLLQKKKKILACLRCKKTNQFSLLFSISTFLSVSKEEKYCVDIYDHQTPFHDIVFVCSKKYQKLDCLSKTGNEPKQILCPDNGNMLSA